METPTWIDNEPQEVTPEEIKARLGDVAFRRLQERPADIQAAFDDTAEIEALILDVLKAKEENNG